jgi:hypothetical protein
LHSSKLLFADYFCIILLGHTVNSAADFIIAEIMEFGYGGMLGVIFIYYAYRTYNKKTLWFKGILLAEAGYLIAYALGTFFRLPELNIIDTTTAVLQVSSTAIFGVLLGLGVLGWGNKLEDLKNY